MSTREFLLALAFSLSSISFSAISAESAVCSNPLKKICIDTQSQRKTREIYIDGIKEKIAKVANKNSAPRIAKLKKIEPGAMNFIQREVEVYKIINQETMKAAKSTIKGFETIITSLKNILMLKNYMRQAIEESNFDQKTKAVFKKTIDSVQIGNFSDFIDRKGVEDSFLGQLFNPCGSDGMAINAFATTIDSERYVLICPGFLITLSQKASEEEKLDSIIQAVSHEMGHHIDNSLLKNDIYMPYLSCISRNYSTQFNKSKEDKSFCKNKGKSPSQCRMKTIMSHANELIADQWGIKTLMIHARSEGYSMSQTDSLLTNSWTNLCGSKDEGVHPSGDFRIGTLLRLNPEISDHLSCNNSAVKKPTCTFDGEIQL